VVVLLPPATLFLMVNDKTIVALLFRLALKSLNSVRNVAYPHFHKNHSINLYSYIVPLQKKLSKKSLWIARAGIVLKTCQVVLLTIHNVSRFVFFPVDGTRYKRDFPVL
jgi:hypothetical protein